MPNNEELPTPADVVGYLNRRFEKLNLPYRITGIAMLPYSNPMWLANWDVPQLADAPERELLDREIAEARWKFPFVV